MSSKQVPGEQGFCGAETQPVRAAEGGHLQWVHPSKGRGPRKWPGVFREQKRGSCGWPGELERPVGGEAAVIPRRQARPCLPQEGVFLLF